MNTAAQVLKTSLTELGYRNGDVHSGFRFAAVDQALRPVRQVDVAAFVEGPASYRTAALGIVRVQASETALEVAEGARSLGAPFLVVINGDEASMWTYTTNGASKLDSAPASQWHALLADRGRFGPGPIRQLKALQVREAVGATASLFDPRTLYGIQAHTQQALDDMLAEFLAYFDATKISAGQLSMDVHYEVLFPLVFRLLAGKILIDRDDARIANVAVDDPLRVVAAVETLYSLASQQLRWTARRVAQLHAAWRALRDGLYVRNVAADDLAFVYETTLVTPETRKRFGTHSTPQSVADYVIRSLQLHEGAGASQLRVYEPFAGSCVFLTAALRRFKEILPQSWSVRKMHEHLVGHFAASEIDPFACEIARLALILADYPNHNGWRITREDLFHAGVLAERISQCDVLLSNPPFEDFEEVVDGLSVHKPVALLDAIVMTPPAFVGLVLPSGFSTHKVYREHLRRLCELYADVEVLTLPEGVFRHASIGAEVLVAQSRREYVASAAPVVRKATDRKPATPETPLQTTVLETTIRKSAVWRSDWSRFEHSLKTSTNDVARVDPITSPGLVGLRPLRDLWNYLSDSPTLGGVATLHRGLEWQIEQSAASRIVPVAGFRPGLHRSGDTLAQFEVTRYVYLDTRPSKLRGGAMKYPWHEPKLILNAIRATRGPWRLEASVDTQGLLVSQQFYGIWLKHADAISANAPALSLVGLCAVLNSPIANAFSFVHDEHKHLRLETLRHLPLPRSRLAHEIDALVADYVFSVDEKDDGPLFMAKPLSPADLLLEIDALVLRAYDLPPKIERALLRFMNEGRRPSRAAFPGYPGTAEGEAAIGLHKRLGMRGSQIRIAWRRLLEPLPEAVADALNLA